MAFVEHTKARSVSDSGGFAGLTPRPGPLLLAYCSIHTVSLIMIYFTISDIFAIALLFR